MAITSALRAGRRVKIAFAASLVPLVLLAAYLAVTRGYELTYGNVREHPQADDSVTTGAFTTYEYLFRPGGTIEYGFSIANHGSLTVRLEEMINDNGLWTIESVRFPFRPLDLRPDVQVVVWVTLRFSEEVAADVCGPLWFNTQTARFNVLGMPREQDVPLGHTIKLVMPKPCS